MALRAATRGSPLALRQTGSVAALWAAAGHGSVEPVVISTLGDRLAGEPIHRIGGKGAFVSDVRAALLAGRADIAVHSAKDLPSGPVPGLALAAVPRRADPRDTLVGNTLKGLQPGARVATGSARRRAQLAWLRPDLSFSELRGNIATRLAKAADFDAIVVAAAALQRLELVPEVSDRLDTSVMVPQVGQGALAVECRADDRTLLEDLAAIEDPESRMAVDAERAFLSGIGADCNLPAGAHAHLDQAGAMTITGMVASLEGRTLLRHSVAGDHPSTLGMMLARHLLDSADGSDLMDSWR